ncbi:MAG: helix-turn-helix domain-containing protein [Nakamurella sp.]
MSDSASGKTGRPDAGARRRRYNAAGRRVQAIATRTRIIEAASRAFLDRGYAGATIPQIAADAGVAVETVYRSATGKAGLLAAAVQAALAGGVERAAQPVEQRAGLRRVVEAPDARSALHAYAATQPGVWSRVGPLLRVLDSAAEADQVLTDLRDSLNQQRLTGMRRFADHLAQRQPLRAGLSTERAADVLWAICGQANYDALVTERGWTQDEFVEWLTQTLAAALLGSD